MRKAERQISRVLTSTDDDSNTLFSDRYQQTYHSTFGARSESAHVFLRGSGVQNRLRANLPTRILEVGFGLGLNCLLCADCAASNSTLLSYTGIDHTPISAATLKELDYGQLLDTPKLANDLAKLLLDLQTNMRISKRGQLGQYCELTLYPCDATSAVLLEELRNNPFYDAIFLDAFSPDVNPECWTHAFLVQLRSLLAPNGRLATYCVKGSVRRNLVAAGFYVNKYPGPKGKREVLWASLMPNALTCFCSE